MATAPRIAAEVVAEHHAGNRNAHPDRARVLGLGIIKRDGGPADITGRIKAAGQGNRQGDGVKRGSVPIPTFEKFFSEHPTLSCDCRTCFQKKKKRTVLASMLWNAIDVMTIYAGSHERSPPMPTSVGQGVYPCPIPESGYRQKIVSTKILRPAYSP